jgi:dipeptidyl aminopeptidase/acylaminoacyl peptidase
VRLSFVLLVLLPALPALPAPQPAPQPDVFLASLSLRGDDVRLGTPANVTARAGYDNQPSFSPDGTALYFTSVRDDAQADIYRYDIATRATTRITVTAPESEYSAAVIGGGAALAVIRVERDSTQRLWRLPLGAGTPAVLLPGVKPAGYFAFADEERIALFVLGTPATLQLAHLRTGAVDTIVANVGRSLHRIPAQRLISYVSRAYQENLWIMSLDPDTRSIAPIAKLPPGTEDYAWLPDGRLVAGQGSKLLVCDPKRTAEWKEVADWSAAGVTAISRLAVSPDGTRIAVVAVPRP